MKKIYSLTILIFLIVNSFSQIPTGYYDNASGKTGATLKTALFNIISAHTVLSYTPGLWDAYKSTDVDRYYENDGSVLDIYSENPTGADPYNFTFISDQCVNYSSEGDCYNREHSFPKSWFNDASPMYSDIFHIYPTDGKVNGQRSNWPYGEVNSPTWTSENGSKLGPCTYPGYTGTVFEPIDEFKGDLARTYFYMATCYEDKIASWETNTIYSDAVLNGTSYPCYETWFLNMLLEWNDLDPVSQKEIDRNDSIYKIQGNRNPYIDHPEYACEVFDANCGVQNPTQFSGTGISISQIDLIWQLNSDNDQVIVAYNTTNTFGTPTGTYIAGNSISGGGEVIYVGTGTSFNHSSLSQQNYYYKIWSYDGVDYSSGTYIIASPLMPEPTNHVSNFSSSATTSSSITLIWTDATGGTEPTNYLIKANLSGNNITTPIDGTTENDATFVKNISQGTQTATFDGLNANTAYDFKIFPYTNTNENIDYKTDGTIPTTNATTDILPTNCGNETFENLSTGSSSYSTVNWTGQDGSSWTATDTRTDQNLGDGAAVCVRNGYVLSGTINNGISDITISTKRAFTGGSGDITVKINDQSVGTVPYSDILQTNTIININKANDFILKLETPNNDDRIIIDDITWGCYATVLNENKENSINIYPNPVTNNRITISTDNLSEKHVVISNINGQILKTEKFSSQEKEINISDLKSGVYFVKIIIDNSVNWKKIIVK